MVELDPFQSTLTSFLYNYIFAIETRKQKFHNYKHKKAGRRNKFEISKFKSGDEQVRNYASSKRSFKTLSNGI